VSPHQPPLPAADSVRIKRVGKRYELQQRCKSATHRHDIDFDRINSTV